MIYNTVGFIGPTSSGKTTCMNAILENPFLGEVFHPVSLATTRPSRGEGDLFRVPGLSRM